MTKLSELSPDEIKEIQKELRMRTGQVIETCQATSPTFGSYCGEPATHYYANCALCFSHAQQFANAVPPPFTIPRLR